MFDETAEDEAFEEAVETGMKHWRASKILLLPFLYRERPKAKCLRKPLKLLSIPIIKGVQIENLTRKNRG